jgi:ribosomal protein S12 methylthiotransferase
VTESKALLASGVKELIFIAQDLGDYGKDASPRPPAGSSPLAHLLQEVLDETREEWPEMWLRLLYLYPDEVSSEVAGQGQQ